MFLFVVVSTAAAIYWARKYWLREYPEEEHETTEMEEYPEDKNSPDDEGTARIRDFLAEEYEALRRPHTQRCVALILQQVAETRRVLAEEEANADSPTHADPQGPLDSLSSGIVDMTGIVDGASGAARAANSI